MSPQGPPSQRAEDVEIIYGIHSVAEAVKNPKRQHLELLATRNAAQRLSSEIAYSGLASREVLPRELDRLLGPEAVHQGLLLRSKPLRQPRLDQIRRQGMVVLLDQVTDPHNVGAILRTCAAFAVTALVATARHSPEASGVLLKAASGAYEHVPFVKITNLARAIEELRSYGFYLIGLDSGAPERLARPNGASASGLVLGAEGKGLRKLTRDTCDAVVQLDLPGVIKSLNVSNAAAIALYELTRP
jgi:23S rRNA (guanosine2251-2'-O)-methyltransferase